MSAETPSVTVARDDERLSTLVEAGDDGELAALVAVDRDTTIGEVVSLLEEVERELGHLVEVDSVQEESEDDGKERVRTDGGDSRGHARDIVRLQREAARENGNLPDDHEVDGGDRRD
jgi:hypothetical protein